MSEAMEKTSVEETTSVKETSKKEAAKTEKTPKKSWFKGLRAEFRKIIWPDKSTVARQTLAVVLVTIVLGVVIVVVDNLIQSGLNFIL